MKKIQDDLLANKVFLTCQLYSVELVKGNGCLSYPSYVDSCDFLWFRNKYYSWSDAYLFADCCLEHVQLNRPTKNREQNTITASLRGVACQIVTDYATTGFLIIVEDQTRVNCCTSVD